MELHTKYGILAHVLTATDSDRTHTLIMGVTTKGKSM